MRVLLKLYNVLKHKDKKHISTSWEVSDTKDFKKILFKSLEDTKHKESIVFNKHLIEDTKYYGRARLEYVNRRAERSSSEWYEITLGKAYTKDELALRAIRPARIDTPKLSTKYEVNEHPFSKFKICGNTFKSTGLDIHKSSIYWIEDNKGSLIWEYHKTTGNLEEIFIPIELDTNKVYRIKSVYVSENNSSSEISSLTIYTSRDRDLQIDLDKNELVIDTDINYICMNIPNSTVNDRMFWELYLEDTKIDSGVVFENKVYTRIENMKLYKPYILKVKKVDGKEDKESTYFPFIIEVPPRVEILDYFPLKFVYKFRK